MGVGHDFFDELKVGHDFFDELKGGGHNFFDELKGGSSVFCSFIFKNDSMCLTPGA